MNRKHIFMIAILGLLCVNCSEEVDPVEKRCNEVCALDSSHACFSRVTNCIADCKSLTYQAAQAARKEMVTSDGEACALCVADQFEYSVSNQGECYGIIKPTTFPDPNCISVCVEPDAGMASY